MHAAASEATNAGSCCSALLACSFGRSQMDTAADEAEAAAAVAAEEQQEGGEEEEDEGGSPLLVSCF